MMINRDLIAVIGQPVRVGSLNGTITLRAITPEPLELSLIIGGPIGADPGIQRVSMHIDSIGLEEAVAEQDSAISELMSEALAASWTSIPWWLPRT